VGGMIEIPGWMFYGGLAHIVGTWLIYGWTVFVEIPLTDRHNES